MYLPNTTALPEQAPFLLAVRDEACGFEGSSDLYGLGIRLGIYLQWLSSFLPRTDTRSMEMFESTYHVFIFALFVAILVLTSQERPTYVAEILILTYIIFGGLDTIMRANRPKPEKNATDEDASFKTLCLAR